MSQQHKPEPFGYFKAEPFGWTDCAETDEGAWPLYDQQVIDDLTKQRDDVVAALEKAIDFVPAGYGIERQCWEALASVKGGT